VKVKRDADKLTERSREQGPCQAFTSLFLKGNRHRSILTASEQKRSAPTRFDKMETRILKMLSGWSIGEIEPLLVNRVIPEAKRRAKVPK
jgi:hypothetical protein